MHDSECTGEGCEECAFEREEVLCEASSEEIMRVRLSDKIDIDWEALVDAPGRLIHDMIWIDAKVDVENGILWFTRVSMKEAEKYLYYMGAENEAKLLWFDGDNIVFGEVSPCRLNRFNKE